MSKRGLITVVIIIAALVAAGVVAFLYQQPASTPANEQPTQTTQPKQAEEERTTEPTQYPVKVYFSRHPESDEDPTRTFPLDRVAPDRAVATYAIKQLLAGPTPGESQDGYFSKVNVRNDTSNCGGADFTLKIVQGTATLQFCRTFDAIGTIADGQADQTIQATLRQFSNVKKVIILSKDGHCQFDLSGEDHCKQP